MLQNLDSDRTKPETQNRVRIPHSFGQNQARNTKSSPNTALIRTEPSPKHRIESEYSTHSDRTKPEIQKRVRIPHSFGQNQAQNTESSPNTALIRTEPSPKHRIESEYRTDSDRTKPKTQNRVRIPHSFGQNQAQNTKSSPNPALIQPHEEGMKLAYIEAAERESLSLQATVQFNRTNPQKNKQSDRFHFN
jgi:hypothetical protein